MSKPTKVNDNMKTKDEFLVKITGPGLTFQRYATAERVHRIVSLLLQPSVASASQSETFSEAQVAESSAGSSNISPKAFMAEKRPKTDVERITCLAFYLTHHRSAQYFKTRDLTDLNKESAQPQLSNAAVAAQNATNYQYLTVAGGGSKQITTRGEALVKALPDREKIKAALEEHSLARRKKKTKSKKQRGRGIK